MTGQYASDCGFLIHKGMDFPDLVFHGTPEERRLLLDSVFTGFGEGCTCHPASDRFGRTTETHLCRPHQFLNEHDLPGRQVEWTTPTCRGGFGPHSYGALSSSVSRADRMLFTRRMRNTWLAQEGLVQHCRSCDQVYMDAQHSCVPERKALPW